MYFFQKKTTRRDLCCCGWVWLCMNRRRNSRWCQFLNRCPNTRRQWRTCSGLRWCCRRSSKRNIFTAENKQDLMAPSEKHMKQSTTPISCPMESCTMGCLNIFFILHPVTPSNISTIKIPFIGGTNPPTSTKMDSWAISITERHCGVPPAIEAQTGASSVQKPSTQKSLDLKKRITVAADDDLWWNPTTKMIKKIKKNKKNPIN